MFLAFHALSVVTFNYCYPVTFNYRYPVPFAIGCIILPIIDRLVCWIDYLTPASVLLFLYYEHCCRSARTWQYVILEPSANYWTAQIEAADNLVARLKGCRLLLKLTNIWPRKLKINIYWDCSRHWRCTVLSCMCPGAFIEHSCSQVLSGGRVNFETLVFTVSQRDLWCECKSLFSISSTVSLVITLAPFLSITVTTKSVLYWEYFDDSNRALQYLL